MVGMPSVEHEQAGADSIASGDSIHLWVGPDVHGLVTTVCDGAQINAVLTHKDVADVAEGWSEPGNRQDVLDCINCWDPSLVRVWEKIRNILDWKLVYRPCLDQWLVYHFATLQECDKC